MSGLYYGEYKAVISIWGGVLSVAVLHQNPDVRAVDRRYELVRSDSYHPTKVIDARSPDNR